MLAVLRVSDKGEVRQRLDDMELHQISLWIQALPEDKWEALFIERWPVLAKKCGVME